MTRRICLFAGYNPQNHISDYVFYYLEALSKFADICYCADGEIFQADRRRLKKLTALAIGIKHGRYDFGSWAELIKKLGWQKISAYDELLLANDSCFGGIFPFNEMFQTMEQQNLDGWGASGNHFIMSYFVNIKKKIFLSPEFRHLFENIKAENNKAVIIKKYERGLDNILQNYNCGTYLSPSRQQKFYKKNKELITWQINKNIPHFLRLLIKITPKKLNLYNENALLPLLMNFPFLKKNLLSNTSSVFPLYIEDIIRQISAYPVSLISNYKRQNHIAFTPQRVIKNKITRFFSSLIFEKKYKRNIMIIKILKIPVFKRQMDYRV